MRDNFDKSLQWVLAHEGGYVNHPADPGGATNQGVTQRVYSAYRRRQGLGSRSVRHLETAERDAIYRRQYWDRVSGDELPAGVDYAVFDFAVNSGVSRAAKFLQRIVGVEADGVIGVVTLEAVDTFVAARDAAALITALCDRRWAWLKTLRTYRTFGRGWTRRVMGEAIGVQARDSGVIDRAVALAIQQPTSAPPIRDDNAGIKARDADRAGLLTAIITFIVNLFGGRR